MGTIKGFCNRYNVRAESTMVDDNPSMDGMPPGSYHYRVTLKCRRRQMTVPFSMGPALDHEPTASEVLSCLVSDATSIDNCRGFEEWAADFGMDTDSRKAERTFKACESQSAKLKAFLGDLYDEATQAEQD